VLLLDKPRGVSSHGALQQARRLYRAEKAGHTGTLDPLATGLLPLCFGAATKFSQLALDADKAYRATLQLGLVTTTGDREGAPLRERPVAASRDEVDAACRRFVGEIDQLPPMHSALKREGRALYDYARAGIVVERAARRVVVHRIDVVAFDGDRLVLDLRCAKGTYVRTLAEDIGEALGCGAHLAALRRTASGAFELGAAHTLEHLAALSEAGRDALLLPADALLAGWPVVRLDEADAARFLSGLPRRIDDGADRPRVRVLGPGGAFLGSGRVAAGRLIPTRLLSPPEARAVADSAAAAAPRAAERETAPS
jgi:tRNA pseudouridine55 synthase